MWSNLPTAHILMKLWHIFIQLTLWYETVSYFCMTLADLHYNDACLICMILATSFLSPQASGALGRAIHTRRIDFTRRTILITARYAIYWPVGARWYEWGWKYQRKLGRVMICREMCILSQWVEPGKPDILTLNIHHDRPLGNHQLSYFKILRKTIFLHVK